MANGNASGLIQLPEGFISSTSGIVAFNTPAAGEVPAAQAVSFNTPAAGDVASSDQVNFNTPAIGGRVQFAIANLLGEAFTEAALFSTGAFDQDLVGEAFTTGEYFRQEAPETAILGEAFTTGEYFRQGPAEANFLGEAFVTIVATLGRLPEASLLGEAFTTAAATIQPDTRIPILGEAFTNGSLDVTRVARNPSLSGDLVDIGNNATFQLTVNGDLIDFTVVTSCFHAFNMADLDISYDGKELSFVEFTSIGSPTYSPEQDVTLEIDFGDGMGLRRLFTGRIRSRQHDGVNNAEQVTYSAVDYMQLSNDLTAINSDGYPQLEFTTLSTVTSITSAFGTFVGSFFTNGSLGVEDQGSKPIREAVQEYFSFNSAQLAAAGIPTDIGAPGLEQFTANLPESVSLDAAGFFSGLQQLTSFQNGVKPFFDEQQQKWIFPNILSAPTVIVDVASTNIPELPFSVDTEGRYTAVRLLADITEETSIEEAIRNKTDIFSLGGPLGFGKIERTEITLEPYWLRDLENNWSLFTALYGNPATIEGENYWVYRRYKLPDNAERPGFGLVPRAFAKYNLWGNEFWQPVEGQTWFNQGIFVAAYPVVNAGGNVWHPGQAFGAEEVKLAYVPGGNIFYFPATSVNSDGSANFSDVGTLFARADFAEEIRVPSTGFEGTAFTDFGIEREYVTIVDRTEVSVENAQAILDVRKDILIEGDIPIEGDPILELMTLGVKTRVLHPTLSTGIESYTTFVTQYSYQFDKRGTSTISVSTDIAGLIQT